MKIKNKELYKIILEEAFGALKQEQPGYLKGLKAAFMRGYKGIEDPEATKRPAPKPEEEPKPEGGLAWGPQGYQDVEWSPSEPLKMPKTPDKPRLGPSIEQTAKDVGITDSELLQQLISKLKGVEVVSGDRPTLTLKQLKDMMASIGVNDPDDPDDDDITDQFINKVVDQGRLHERISEILTERKASKPLAIIAGDSQTYHAGSELGKILKNNFKVLRAEGKTWASGNKTSATLAKLKALPEQQAALVVVFTGGNNLDSGPQTGRQVATLINFIKKKFGNPEIIIGANPPAMKPKSESLLKKFGFKKKLNIPKGQEKEYWSNWHLNRAGGSYAKKREGRAAAIMQASAAAGAKAFDPRQILPEDFHQLTHNDGIHLSGKYAKAFAQGIAGLVTGEAAAKQAATEAPAVESKLAQRAIARSGRCNRAGYVGFGSEKMSDKHQEIIAKIQIELLRNKLISHEELKAERSAPGHGIFGPKTLAGVIELQQYFKLNTDGCIGPKTAKAIGVDDIVDPKNEMRFVATWGELKQLAAGETPSPEEEGTTEKEKAPAQPPSKGASLDEKQFAEKHGLDANILAAFVTMESGGRGFVSSDPKDPDSPKRMLIRFEPHVFVRLYIKGGKNPENIPYYVPPPRTDEEAEELAQRFKIPVNKLKILIGMPLRRAIRYGAWSKMQRINASRTGFRRSGSGIARLNYREWDGLNNALKLDKDAAYKSISMGTGQVMGFNYRRLGYSSPEEMFNALNDYSDEGRQKQKQAKLKFIESSPRLLKAIRDKQWERIGKLYNGSVAYGKKLEKVYNSMVA